MKSISYIACAALLSAWPGFALAGGLQEQIEIDLSENNAIRFSGADVEAVMVSQQDQVEGVSVMVKEADTLIVSGNNETGNGNVVVVLKDGRIYPVSIRGTHPEGQTIVSGISVAEYLERERGSVTMRNQN